MATTDSTQESISTADQTQPLEQPTVGLTLQDLVLVAQIIQVCSQRGAVRAEEMAQVGTLYTKLVAFLEASGAVQRPVAEAATQETPNA